MHCLYFMPKKSCPFLYCKYTMKIGQDFSDIRCQDRSVVDTKVAHNSRVFCILFTYSPKSLVQFSQFTHYAQTDKTFWTYSIFYERDVFSDAMLIRSLGRTLCKAYNNLPLNVRYLKRESLPNIQLLLYCFFPPFAVHSKAWKHFFLVWSRTSRVMGTLSIYK